MTYLPQFAQPSGFSYVPLGAAGTYAAQPGRTYAATIAGVTLQLPKGRNGDKLVVHSLGFSPTIAADPADTGVAGIRSGAPAASDTYPADFHGFVTYQFHTGGNYWAIVSVESASPQLEVGSLRPLVVSASRVLAAGIIHKVDTAGVALAFPAGISDGTRLAVLKENGALAGPTLDGTGAPTLFRDGVGAAVNSEDWSAYPSGTYREYQYNSHTGVWELIAQSAFSVP